MQLVFHELPALFGFCILMTIYNQLVTGVVLALSYPTESMYTPLSREFESAEAIYSDEFLWAHERGVDFFAFFLFLHMFRKMYINALTPSHEVSWKGGVLLFLLAQFVIFTGLTLSCTHLSEVTLTIAINAFNSFCLFIGRISWLIAPFNDLNIDTVARLAYMHYLFAFILAFFGVYHGLDMHYNWKTEEVFDGISQELDWFDEAIINELSQVYNLLGVALMIYLLFHMEPESVHYELFMWGDVGMVTDIRFFGVAPHWYFRPYMGWLVTCPYHYLGLIGLVLFFIGFFFQPTIMRFGDFKEYSGTKVLVLKFLSLLEDFSKKVLNVLPFTVDQSLFYNITFSVFLISIWYAFSYLPYGRFFITIGGNKVSNLCYMYIFFYLSLPNLRRPRVYSFTQLKIF